MTPPRNHINNIVTSLNNGQQQALDELFAQYYRALVYFAMRIIKNQEEAEDIVIESFSKLWNNRAKMASAQNIKGFLYLTTRNACVDHLRAQRKFRDIQKELQVLADPIIENTDIDTTRAEMIRHIYEEMEKLPQQCRNIFKLSVIKGLKSRDIASELNISVSNVTSQKSRALQLLRTALVKGMILFIVGMM
ncbi:MAG: RNA polymerase sigma-70 factor [Chitinophagaceae bacterium]|nr:RNA polymerase sigma-70 factor [Chitinophagaceae bacterium]